jgi:uncharacterized membrane protein YedE/YeeE
VSFTQPESTYARRKPPIDAAGVTVDSERVRCDRRAALTGAVARDDAPHMVRALIGGICIGVASGLVVLLLGRVSGITGIVAGAWPGPHRDWAWRTAFLVGLVVAGSAGTRLDPAAIAGPAVSWPLALVAGLLVGFGARYGGGCTSSHGVCGVGRLSRRSIVGCGVFVVVAMAVVFVVRRAGRGL